MEGTGTWIAGGVAGVVAVIGLLAASRAHDPAFYWGGFIIAAAAVATIFGMIHRHYNRVDAALTHTREGEGDAPKA